VADDHHVSAFATCDEAGAWLKDHRCDLVFVAIGREGREWSFIREAKLFPPPYGVALSTGAVDLEKIRRAEFGFRDWLLKPFSPDELDAIVAAAQREHAAPTPAEVEVDDDTPCAA
jgi:DNA-binding response OmpR family regulator